MLARDFHRDNNWTAAFRLTVVTTFISFPIRYFNEGMYPSQHLLYCGFLDFIHRPVFEGTRRFRNWICFRPHIKGGKKTPTQLGPLERANLSLFPHFTWRRKQSQFPKRRVPSNTERWIKSRNPKIPCVIHHLYNPSETTYLLCFLGLPPTVYTVSFQLHNTSVPWPYRFHFHGSSISSYETM
jgi:hypothetical protein